MSANKIGSNEYLFNIFASNQNLANITARVNQRGMELSVRQSISMDNMREYVNIFMKSKFKPTYTSDRNTANYMNMLMNIPNPKQNKTAIIGFMDLYMNNVQGFHDGNTEVIKLINAEFLSFLFNNLGWNGLEHSTNVYRGNVMVGPAYNRYMKSMSDLTPDEIGTLGLWKGNDDPEAISSVGNINRNRNKIDPWKRGMHMRSYDPSNEGYSIPNPERSSLETFQRGISNEGINIKQVNYHKDDWFEFTK